MTFDDLPQNFRDLSLDDPVLRSDAIDLFVSLADREAGSFTIVLLDDGHRVLQPVVISELGEAEPAEVVASLRRVLSELDTGGIVAALGRDGSPLFSDRDRTFHQLTVDLCRDLGLDLLGFYLAAPATVREMPDHLRMAS
ncbi:hypothetical protein [Knoellia sp. Soil729]|uniref:hypothetical protein n=1 Tax=Knoellia sp. Soil729 TaxID=1736394 RepID=UPI0006FF048D|nr:hypothetical protein [Knoellia sp. Soil729]KRE41455.1 hypothetical protein ASG74_12990 [Knoellia sp. Soil729]